MSVEGAPKCFCSASKSSFGALFETVPNGIPLLSFRIRIVFKRNRHPELTLALFVDSFCTFRSKSCLSSSHLKTSGYHDMDCHIQLMQLLLNHASDPKQTCWTRALKDLTEHRLPMVLGTLLPGCNTRHPVVLLQKLQRYPCSSHTIFS